ncbi:MAG: helix-turn-helix domain-containing protein [Lachnospiraceae bacterium]|nr:helix-turn-helix domain-containing protein [Lachnospiraceae bacterium]
MENKREKAMKLFETGCNCSQAVLLAFAEDFGLEKEKAAALSVPFGGGMSKQGKTCGCLSAGGIMRVPGNFMNEEEKGRKADIFLKTYVEHESSKIYTKVEENLLVIVLKGKKHLIYQDFETTISEGEYAMFRKGNYIMNQIISDHEYESLLIFMSDDFLNRSDTLKEKQECFHVPFYQGKMIPHMKNEVDKIHKFMKQEEYQEIIQLKIRELLIYIQNQDKTGDFKRFLYSFSSDEDFRNSVYRNYMQYQNVAEMAKALHMSISTLKRKFQKHFGCSPHLWMNEKKLEKAVMLLDTSDYSIIDIGFICGFSSLSTFMGQFKKKYGVSPGTYRKESSLLSAGKKSKV